MDGGETWYRVTGEKGDKGEQGDKGNTGSRGPAGADGDSFFKDVKIAGNDAVFTLANGTTFSIPLYTGIKLNFTQSSLSLFYGTEGTVSFTAEGSDSFTTDNLFLIAPDGWEASIAAQTRALPSSTFTLTVAAPDEEQVSAGTATASGEILVLLDNGQGNTTIGRIKVATKTTLNGTELTAVNLQAGELAKAIGSHADLTSITVTSGTLNSTDWTAIQQNKAALLYLNLGGATYREANLVYSNIGTTVPLKEVKLPQGITGLGVSAFWTCSSLTSITLPEGLTSIGVSAFWNCSSLTTITLPEGLTSIGVSAFWNCSSLTSINLPEGLKSIGQSAFNNCSDLTTVTLPEGLKSIGVQAFNGCSDLTTITLPEGLTSIGTQAFNYCSSLTTVTCLATTPPTLEVNAFSGCNALIDIYVPAGSVDTYKAATRWSDYAGIIQAIPGDS